MLNHARERAECWASSPRFDSDTRAAARRILEDGQALAGCFGGELTFGTGGLRGVMGVGTRRMNRYTVARATEGLARYLLQQGGSKVAIAWDSRHGSQEFAHIAAGVLARRGLSAYLFSGLASTPLLSYAVRTLGCDAGIVITASHNPAQYNGYKVYDSAGCQITDGMAREIAQWIDQVAYDRLEWLEEWPARQAGRWLDISRAVLEDYVERTLACRLLDGQLPELKLIYTPLNGTGMALAERLLPRLERVKWRAVPEQALPDGDFPTCPKPNPELPEAMRLALEWARQEQAELVVANDPDCDRVSVASHERDGSFRLLTGNELGLLLLDDLLRERAARGALPQDALVYKSIVSSDLAYPIARTYGAQVREVLTGFKYIGEAVGRLERAGQGARFVFGFEESCGYLAGTHVRDKDGAQGLVLAVGLAQRWKRRGYTLGQAMDALCARYGYIESVAFRMEMELDRARRAMAGMRREPMTELGGQACTVQDYLEGVDGLPPSDVLCYQTADGLKAILRPSGTEPLLKGYCFASAADPVGAQRRVEALAQQLRRRIQQAAL